MAWITTELLNRKVRPTELLLALILLLNISFFSFIYFAPFLHVFYTIILIIITLNFVLGVRSNSRKNFDFLIGGLVSFRLISVVPAKIFHDQSIIDTLIAERIVVMWGLYWCLHKWDINPDWIIKLIKRLGLIWASINILQQFSYPFYLFAIKDVYERAGVLRFVPNGVQYGLLAVYTYLHSFLKNKNFRSFLKYFFLLIGIYFFSVRQIIASVLFVSTFSMFFLVGKTKIRSVLFALSLFFVITILYTSTLSNYAEITKSEVDENNIRVLAAYFFGVEFFPDILCNILGNGYPHSQSAYGHFVYNFLQEDLKLFRADVGIIGTYNQYGIIYAVIVLLCFVKVLFMKIGKAPYLKLFAFSVLSLLPLSEYTIQAKAIPFFCVYFYLVDKHQDFSS